MEISCFILLLNKINKNLCGVFVASFWLLYFYLDFCHCKFSIVFLTSWKFLDLLGGQYPQFHLPMFLWSLYLSVFSGRFWNSVSKAMLLLPTIIVVTVSCAKHTESSASIFFFLLRYLPLVFLNLTAWLHICSNDFNISFSWPKI